MAALYLSGRQDPDGGASSEEELSGISLLEDSSLELDSSSLELDSSSSDEELEDSSLPGPGSEEELLSSAGSAEELVLGASSEEELDFAPEDCSGEADVSITEELLSLTEELLECSLCEELLLLDFFHSGRPSAGSQLHFASASQESIMASSSFLLIFSNFPTATMSSASGVYTSPLSHDQNAIAKEITPRMLKILIFIMFPYPSKFKLLFTNGLRISLFSP